jgi:hypothetical protein
MGSEGAPRSSGRGRRLLLLVPPIALLALPAGVWATDTFGDVSSDNVHHDAVAAVADAGVALGCTPDAYCPADSVRRDQMASFLDRLGALSGQDPVVNAATADSAVIAENAEQLAGMRPEAFASSEQLVPFSVTMSSHGEEATILEHGSLRIFARCDIDVDGSDRVTVLVSGSEHGWYHSATSSTGAGQSAGDEVMLATTQTTTGGTITSRTIDRGAALGADGAWVAMQGETTMVGLNVHGTACLVAGVAFAQDVAL